MLSWMDQIEDGCAVRDRQQGNKLDVAGKGKAGLLTGVPECKQYFYPVFCDVHVCL